MSSEDQKLKPGTVDESNVMKINNNKKKEEEQKIKRKVIIPFVNYRKINIFSISIINYFAIGISLFVYGCTNLELFKLTYNTEFCLGYYLVSGIVLYIIGILDWCEGKDLAFLIDFIYAFYFVSLFLREQQMGDITIINNDNNKLHGSFYIIFFCFIIVIAISYKSKGKIYVIDYTILFFGYLFLFFYKYIEADWLKKVFSIIFIISGCIFWITGVLKIIDNYLSETSIAVLDPNDD